MSERTVQIVGQRGGEPAATEPGAQPGAALDPRAAAWVEYLDAARQLDAVRRGAATAAGEQAQSAQSARELLTEVRARLAPQHSHLRELDVPAMTLSPTPPEVTAAGRRMTAGPEAVAACLREAAVLADTADGMLAGGDRLPLRSLLLYGPLAALVPLLQVLLYVSTGAGAWTVVSLLAGLPLAAALVAAVGVATHRIAGGREGRARRGGSLGLTLALAGTLLSTTIIGVTLMIG
ncbi:hypothetical protein ACK8GE_19685 [Micromonosporaceae bacterium DT194]|uniref:hypothetical protein n=1 Tax=Melissospora conviva TaxID=3388432 RepID=UPI003C2A29FD